MIPNMIIPTVVNLIGVDTMIVWIKVLCVDTIQSEREIYCLNVTFCQIKVNTLGIIKRSAVFIKVIKIYNRLSKHKQSHTKENSVRFSYTRFLFYDRH